MSHNARAGAYPRPHSLDTSGDFPRHEYAQEGLMKRELLAAMAMQGLLANAGAIEGIDAAARAIARRGGVDSVTAGEVIARGAVLYADALLAELAK